MKLFALFFILMGVALYVLEERTSAKEERAKQLYEDGRLTTEVGDSGAVRVVTDHLTHRRWAIFKGEIYEVFPDPSQTATSTSPSP